MSYSRINYDYKNVENKKGNRVSSIMDNGENVLLEVEKVGNEVEIVTYYRNVCTTRIKVPLELFNKMYHDMASESD